jgi:hypothetical protein
MTIRVVQATVTVAAPDVYGTPTTFTAGQILDIAPGSAWETAIGAGSVPVLAGAALASDQSGSGGPAMANS